LAGFAGCLQCAGVADEIATIGVFMRDHREPVPKVVLLNNQPCCALSTTGNASSNQRKRLRMHFPR
jgi:hypothetical protein